MKTAMIPLLVLAASARAADASPWKVEYAEVEGMPCLEPTRLTADVKLEDFRDAERRWLDEHQPGWDEKVLRSKARFAPTELFSNEEPAYMVVERDTFEIELPDRSTRTICFEINLRMPKAEKP